MLVKRRTRTIMTASLLLIWQVGAGVMMGLAGAPAHGAQPSVPAGVMATAVPEAEAPCHGQDQLTDASITRHAPADDSPCCQFDGCHGDCLVNPALPSAPRIVAVMLGMTSHAQAPRLAPVPVLPVEFFRPPI